MLDELGAHDDVLTPRLSTKTDWEVEPAVVILRTARYLPDPASTLQRIAGYTISNDVSEREFQLERGSQWDKGKSCETFNPPRAMARTGTVDPRPPGPANATLGERATASVVVY